MILELVATYDEATDAVPRRLPAVQRIFNKMPLNHVEPYGNG